MTLNLETVVADACYTGCNVVSNYKNLPPKARNESNGITILP